MYRKPQTTQVFAINEKPQKNPKLRKRKQNQNNKAQKQKITIFDTHNIYQSNKPCPETTSMSHVIATNNSDNTTILVTTSAMSPIPKKNNK